MPEHSAGIALNRNGNQGWAYVSEDEDGNVVLEAGGTAVTLDRVTMRKVPADA